jgi:NADH dehydrogenase I D subunit
VNATLQGLRDRFGGAVTEAAENACGESVVTVRKDSLLALIEYLRADGFSVLSDLAAVDYLTYSQPQPGRFGIVYHLQDLPKRRRIRVKTHAIPPDLRVPSVSRLWKGADWLEREAWDQFGVVFDGHPNLKRILNHHEFVGHPLRKDYPIKTRQPLSENDTLVDEMALRLKRNGIRVPQRDRDILAMAATPFSDHGELAPPGAPSHGAGGGATTATLEAVQNLSATGALLTAPEFYADLHTDLMFLNLGPSHPASHGTLRTFVALDGETIVAAVTEMGYLHRGFEKTTETQTYNGCIPYTDRLNYVSAILNNFAFCKAVERLLAIETTPRCKAIRVVIGELSRIIDHLVCIGTNLVDIGALTNFWYAFNVRERVYDIFDRLTGARLTNSYGRIGGLARDFYPGCAEDILKVLKEIEKTVVEMEKLVKKNRIFLDRVQDVCTVSAEDALSFGWTGPPLRASGVDYDIRKAYPYDGYDQYDFDIPVGTKGDTYDRIFVRFYEIAQSASIIRQALKQLPGGPIYSEAKHVSLPEKDATYNNIEGLMNHFKLVFEGVRVPAGEVYDASEAANGELGFYLVADGSGKPYRCRCRPPSFQAFAAFADMIEGEMVADAVATLGSINIIAGELDR